ncbi:MAG: hypothetical protein DME44_10095 [Verrucomicrobia bacterium]|nr:MAG: hypothetical protein DME44_10095 [Verrucomicrobiota bacterium]
MHYRATEFRRSLQGFSADLGYAEQAKLTHRARVKRGAWGKGTCEVLGNHRGSVTRGGWSYGIAEHITKHGFLFCVDAHRDGKRFIIKADDLLTAFLLLERDAIVPKGANSRGT